ncbi:MAG: carbohydrate kinase family protein [bacterium]
MSNLLLGVVCYDKYIKEHLTVPGGVILHNSYHLASLGCEHTLCTRIGSINPEIFIEFFKNNSIPVNGDYILDGESSSIDINIIESGEAKLDNIVKGVSENFELTVKEERLLYDSINVHIALSEQITPEFERLCYNHSFDGKTVSVDFMDLRHTKIEKFNEYFKYIDIAFIGWNGNMDDPVIDNIKDIAQKYNILVVITFGEKGIIVYDARIPEFKIKIYQVNAIEVEENTNGCGDAFISYFLNEYWKTEDLNKSIEFGKVAGAEVTKWKFALPENAYNLKLKA